MLSIKKGLVMALQWKNAVRCLVVPLLGLVAAAHAVALTDTDVKRLGKKCEAARSEALAPIRAERTRVCIEQQLKSKGHCERYYTTYGNVAPSASGTPQQGYYYNLPECQEWLTAREKLRVSRSRL
jgi:hypothetical protein